MAHDINLETSQPQSPGFFGSFAAHPASVGESYFGHLWFALRFASKLFAAGGAAVVHAIIPAWFETTASRLICDMYADMQARHGVEN